MVVLQRRIMNLKGGNFLCLFDVKMLFSPNAEVELVREDAEYERPA